MLTIVQTIIDSIFPPRDTDRLVRTITETGLQTFYRPTQYSIATALSSYQNKNIKALIAENKYYENRRAASLLARLLEIWLHTQPDTQLVLIPIPQSPKRARERGYNQVTKVLKHLPQYETNTTILRRTTESASQTTLHKSARLQNMHGAFWCESKQIMGYSNTTFVIVDDVITTGATMRAAYAAFLPHLSASCRIVCVALAH